MQSNNSPPSLWEAVDPGHTESAIAVSYNGQTLASCGLIPTPAAAADPRLGWNWNLVVEFPEVLDGFTKDPNSVLKVRDAANRWEMLTRWGAVRRVRPSEWKGGSVKKPPCHQRLCKVLTPAEREIVSAALGMAWVDIVAKIDKACLTLARTGKLREYAWSAHNVLDAVGILLFALGRF